MADQLTTVSIGIDGGASNSTLVVLRVPDGAVLGAARGVGLNPWTQSKDQIAADAEEAVALSGSEGNGGDGGSSDAVTGSSMASVARTIVELVRSATQDIPRPLVVDVVGTFVFCALRVARCALRVVRCALRVARCALHVARCVLRFVVERNGQLCLCLRYTRTHTHLRGSCIMTRRKALQFQGWPQMTSAALLKPLFGSGPLQQRRRRQATQVWRQPSTTLSSRTTCSRLCAPPFRVAMGYY